MKIPARYIIFNFKKIDNLVATIANKRLAANGITGSQLDVLRVVKENTNQITTQKDIERALNLSNPTVTGLLNRMEEKKFIERVVCEEDKRIRIIRVTKEAKKVQNQFFSEMEKSTEKILSCLSQKEKDELYRMQEKVLISLLNETQKNE